MDYTNLPFWVHRVIRHIHLYLKQQGVYYFHVNDPILDLERPEDDIICIRLRHKVKITCRLPSGCSVKATIHHRPNRRPLVETEGMNLTLNRLIIIRKIS